MAYSGLQPIVRIHHANGILLHLPRRHPIRPPNLPRSRSLLPTLTLNITYDLLRRTGNSIDNFLRLGARLLNHFDVCTSTSTSGS